MTQTAVGAFINPGATTGTFTVQPPAGEVWSVNYRFGAGSAANDSGLCLYDGSHQIPIQTTNGGNKAQISNSLYFYMSDSGTGTHGTFEYHGIKVPAVTPVSGVINPTGAIGTFTVQPAAGEVWSVFWYASGSTAVGDNFNLTDGTNLGQLVAGSGAAANGHHQGISPLIYYRLVTSGTGNHIVAAYTGIKL